MQHEVDLAARDLGRRRCTREHDRRFDDAPPVRCVATPAGEVAMTRHIGPYALLADAHNAIHAWAAGAGRRIGPASWEIYGDWAEDEKQLETTVKYLLL